MSKSLRSGKSKKDTCENEFEAFVSGGVENSFTCDAITEDSLNFLAELFYNYVDRIHVCSRVFPPPT